jgi:hypothetical protein
MRRIETNRGTFSWDEDLAPKEARGAINQINKTERAVMRMREEYRRLGRVEY